MPTLYIEMEQSKQDFVLELKNTCKWEMLAVPGWSDDNYFQNQGARQKLFLCWLCLDLLMRQSPKKPETWAQKDVYSKEALGDILVSWNNGESGREELWQLGEDNKD